MLNDSFAFCSVRTSELSNVFVVGSVWTLLVKKNEKRPFGVFLLMTNFRSISFDNALLSRLSSVIVLSVLGKSSNIVSESEQFFFSRIFLIDDKIFALIEVNESVSLTSFINNVPSSLIS